MSPWSVQPAKKEKKAAKQEQAAEAPAPAAAPAVEEAPVAAPAAAAAAPAEEKAAEPAKKAEAKPAAAGGISAALVKELREATGAGMMDCKKALAECEGDLEKAKEVGRGVYVGVRGWGCEGHAYW